MAGLSERQIAIVRSSWARVVPTADLAARLFYGRLFTTHPGLRHLFHADIDRQGEKLVATLDAVVGNLDRMDDILPTARALAIRHVGYGVEPWQYAPVGAALLWMIEQIMGREFTLEVAEAWRAAYGAVSGAMVDAAYPDAPRTASVPFARPATASP